MDSLLLHLHDLIRDRRYHQARDVASKLLAAVERELVLGNAADQCMQAQQGKACCHVNASMVAEQLAADVWG